MKKLIALLLCAALLSLCACTANVQSGKTVIAASFYPIYIFTLNLVDGIDGIELLKRMKADDALKDIPIVMATAKGSEYDKIQGLDLGADYYIAKPFGVMELISCVKAVLRRVRPAVMANELKAGGVAMNLEERIVSVDGERIQLTYKEFELLKLLLSHPKTAFTREQLMSEVWGTDYVGETRTVDMHIRTLR